MSRVLADHADDVLTLYDAARLAKALNGCSDFHDGLVKLATSSEDEKSRWKLKGSSAIDDVLLLLTEGNPPFRQVVGGDL